MFTIFQVCTATTTTTTQTRPQCPTDDPQYVVLEGRCVYIEKTRLTHIEAIENCQEKLKNYGGGILYRIPPRTYKPYSIETQKRVVDKALEHGLEGWST